MDFCRVTHAGDPDKGEADEVEVLLTTHETGADDMTPLQMITSARLAQLLALEEVAKQLAALLMPAD